MERTLEPEILDHLSPEDPEALSSRKDLRFFNVWLGTGGWFERELVSAIEPDDCLLEIGAGEGCLAGRLQRRAAERGSDAAAWAALDRHRMEKSPGKGGGIESIEADLHSYPDMDRFSVIFGNMILHHFDKRELRDLGRRLTSRSRLLVFQETLRSSFHLSLCRGISIFMARPTRTDAPASVRAGFRRDELPRWLGLDRAEWSVCIRHTPRGAYRMVARRHD